jgi:hypothetical protein
MFIGHFAWATAFAATSYAIARYGLGLWNSIAGNRSENGELG